MKKTITISILFLAMVGISLFEVLYAEHAFSRLDKKLEAFEQTLDTYKDDLTSPDCTEKLDDLIADWKREYKFFSVMLPHNSVVELALKFSRLEATVLGEDYEMAKIELFDLIRVLPEYRDRYRPSIVNIL